MFCKMQSTFDNSTPDKRIIRNKNKYCLKQPQFKILKRSFYRNFSERTVERVRYSESFTLGCIEFVFSSIQITKFLIHFKFQKQAIPGVL